jgi:hypothetical protein
MFIFSECDSFYKAEISCISELIETKTKMMEAKYLSEIKLIKAELAKLGSDKLIDCPIDKPSFRIVDGTCLR